MSLGEAIVATASAYLFVALLVMWGLHRANQTVQPDLRLNAVACGLLWLPMFFVGCGLLAISALPRGVQRRPR